MNELDKLTKLMVILLAILTALFLGNISVNGYYLFHAITAECAPLEEKRDA